jgi:hypothetical protein
MIQGYVLWDYPFLRDVKKPLIVDLVCPIHIEDLEQGRVYQASLSLITESLRRGDFFICGHEIQRAYWLGMLTSLKKVNRRTRDIDPSFRSLIDVVPFGIPEEPPVKKNNVLKGIIAGIKEDDILFLWWGGIWDWLDPFTVIKAVAKASKDNPRIKLFFPFLRRPQGEIPRTASASVQLSKDLGIFGKNVFFNEFPIEYKKRSDYLLEGDAGIICQPDHLETFLAIRTRGLDYIWAGLPVITTKGDHFSEQVEKQEIGLTVDFFDVEGWREAILSLSDEKERARFRDNIGKIRHLFYWDNIIEPICRYFQRL